MESLTNYLKIPEVKKHGSERGDLLTYFHERILDKKGKHYRISYLGMRLAHLKVHDLYYLQSICKQSNNFEKTFWGSIKKKEV